MGECKICGRETLPGQVFCMQCKPSGNRNARPGKFDRSPRGRDFRPRIPYECLFKDSFYADDGYLKREVFLEASEKMARILQDPRMTQRVIMTQTSIRRLFNSIKDAENRLKSDRSLSLGFVRENFAKFLRDTEYQVRRGIVPEVFGEFVNAHKEIGVKSKEEFRGFVEYLTSIVARMKQK
jgi:hypothetical protein